jgi:peptidoglycan hydrolase CwlO-like protein
MSSDPKPYVEIKIALDAWRAFDDPIRSDLRGKRNRRRLAAALLTVLVAGCMGLGLTVVGLLQQHEANLMGYSESVTRMNEMLAEHQSDVLEDIQSRLDDRRAQLTGMNTRLEASESKLEQLRARKADASRPEPAPDGGSPVLEPEGSEELEREIIAAEALALQLRAETFKIERLVASLEAELEHVGNDLAVIQQEREARQKQVEDEHSPVTALQADLESAERRVAALVETDAALRALNKRIMLECESSEP